MYKNSPVDFGRRDARGMLVIIEQHQGYSVEGPVATALKCPQAQRYARPSSERPCSSFGDCLASP